MNTIAIKSLFAVLAALFLFTLMPGEAQAAQCGGLNQKSCWSVNPKKWCNPGLKYVGNGKPGGGRCIKPPVSKPTPKPEPKCGGLNQKSCWNVNPAKWCNPGLKYDGTGKPGEGRCVKPSAKPAPKPQCGGLNQKSCWNVNPAKWCNPGLKYDGTGKPGEGRCRAPDFDTKPSCGGLNQKSCWSANPTKWCEEGLKYVATGKPGEGMCRRKDFDAKPDCGGLNQKSCWNANPAKWCDEGLEYFGTGKPGEGRCLVPGSDPTPDCGGENEKSCWNANPKHWCDDGFSYSPGVIPGEGTCYRKHTDEEYKAASQDIFNRVMTLGMDTPMMRLRTCLLIPENLEKLKEAMTGRSENGVNRLLSICRVSPDDLKEYGMAALGDEPQTLQIGLSGNLSLGVGLEGSISYAIPLHANPDGRYFLTNGLSAGVTAGGGVDVSVALTTEEMPTEHWAVDKGRSVSFSAKAAGLSVDFPEREITPSGFTVSGGVGAGVDYGAVIVTRDQYLYNF